MGDEVYRKLAGVLDTIPNGFPATESGVAIRLLKKIFTLDLEKFLVFLFLFCHSIVEIKLLAVFRRF